MVQIHCREHLILAVRLGDVPNVSLWSVDWQFKIATLCRAGSARSADSMRDPRQKGVAFESWMEDLLSHLRDRAYHLHFF